MSPAPASPPNPRGDAFPIVAGCGLILVAVHAVLGNGVVAPEVLLDPRTLAAALPLIWPYLAFAVGLLGMRRWARDLAAPAALLALTRALAAFPRYGFLAWAAQVQSGPSGRDLWPILRHSLVNQAAYAALCGVLLYVLVQPELIQKCQSERKQPGWTDGLGFAALLLISAQIFTASAALPDALNHASALGGSAAIPGAPGAPAEDPSAAWLSVGLAALAVLALVGLWLRRGWGVAALLMQNGILLSQAADTALGKALAALSGSTSRFPQASLPLALEAFSRNLPELAAIALVVGFAPRARRQFKRGSSAPPPQSGTPSRPGA
jgi:hypothetical protein